MGYNWRDSMFCGELGCIYEVLAVDPVLNTWWVEQETPPAEHTNLHSKNSHSATRSKDLVYLYRNIFTRRVDHCIKLFRGAVTTVRFDQCSELLRLNVCHEQNLGMGLKSHTVRHAVVL